MRFQKPLQGIFGAARRSFARLRTPPINATNLPQPKHKPAYRPGLTFSPMSQSGQWVKRKSYLDPTRIVSAPELALELRQSRWARARTIAENLGYKINIQGQ